VKKFNPPRKVRQDWMHVARIGEREMDSEIYAGNPKAENLLEY
jgi:hypothetical protein